MNESWKKAGLILGVSLIIFIIFRPKKDGEKGLFSGKANRTPLRKPSLDDASLTDPQVRIAYDALCAYIEAYNEGESDAVLSGIKNDFKSEMGIDIYTDAAGKLAVKDADGDDLLVN